MTYLPKWLKLKRWRISSVDKDVEQLELSCTASGSVKQSRHFGSFLSDLLKLNGHISYVTVILLSGECQQDAPSVHQKTCTRVLMAGQDLGGDGVIHAFPSQPTQRTLTRKRQNRSRRGQERKKAARSLPAAQASGGHHAARTANMTG